MCHIFNQIKITKWICLMQNRTFCTHKGQHPLFQKQFDSKVGLISFKNTKNLAICSQNCVWNLEFAIDFWCLQLTFDVFNWVYSKHMIHYNKVNWKNFAKNFLKIFPIDFQSPIDFTQLHMIRPLDQGIE